MSLPQINHLDVIIVQDDVLQPSLTLDESNIMREIDGLEALKQSIRRVLQTERYSNSIYDHRYGVELDELIGEDMGFARIDVERRIKEALMEDDRIEEVSEFTTRGNGNELHVMCTVVTKLGDIRQKVIIG